MWQIFRSTGILQFPVNPQGTSTSHTANCTLADSPRREDRDSVDTHYCYGHLGRTSCVSISLENQFTSTKYIQGNNFLLIYPEKTLPWKFVTLKGNIISPLPLHYVAFKTSLLETINRPDMAAHSCNYSSLEAEAGGTPWVWGPPELHSELKTNLNYTARACLKTKQNTRNRKKRLFPSHLSVSTTSRNKY